MRPPLNRVPEQHGYAEVKLSRYFALYLAQAGWLLLGAFLFSIAYWPSSCVPDGLIEVYACSAKLPETGDWPEAALLTWLWTTPILIALELSRRFGPFRDGGII